MRYLLFVLVLSACGSNPDSPGCDQADFTLEPYGLCVLHSEGQLNAYETDVVFHSVMNILQVNQGWYSSAQHMSDWFVSHQTVISWEDDVFHDPDIAGYTFNYSDPLDESSWIALRTTLGRSNKVFALGHELIHVFLFMYQHTDDGHPQPFFGQSFPAGDENKSYDFQAYLETCKEINCK